MFARTPRLTLRPGWPEDAAALAAAIAHECVVTRLSRAPWPYDERDAGEFLTHPRGPSEAVLLITTIEPDGARVIGGIGIHAEATGHELGYWLTPDAWGRGLATEAGRHMLQIARVALGLRRLTAGHYIDNPASGRVLTKLGFTPTGSVEPQFCRALGREVPCVRMTIDLTETGRALPLAA